jgi:hypothetical protein
MPLAHSFTWRAVLPGRSSSGRDALRQVFFFDAEPDQIGFGGREASDAIAQSQNRENGCIHAQAHCRVSALNAQQGRPTDLCALGDHCRGEPTATPGVLEILSELCQRPTDAEGQ